MLVSKNTHFKEFIENVNDDIDTCLISRDSDRIVKKKYDKIFSDDELIKYKKQYGIE